MPNGRVAQLGERLVRNEEVSGSIPLTSIRFLIHGQQVGAVLVGEEDLPPPGDFLALRIAPLEFIEERLGLGAAPCLGQ